MVGHSLGGYLSFELLRQADPGRIRSLLLCSTQVRADTPAIQRHRRMLMDKTATTAIRILVGDEDGITPRACSAEMGRLVGIDGAVTAVGGGVGHLLPLEAPRTLAEALLELWDETDPE
ncbi:hypothetical protein TeGR_g11603 [Tetraparma gracilis]|uniref:Uncharacterized protein n=1 Tax=Tetraparma gracilis TaxID=2962635 RepID=A0ABQ6M785_9STRA|nr:hypothetical protein TeGR_g11603 [Tetraparma gracilis]